MISVRTKTVESIKDLQNLVDSRTSFVAPSLITNYLSSEVPTGMYDQFTPSSLSKFTVLYDAVYTFKPGDGRIDLQTDKDYGQFIQWTENYNEVMFYNNSNNLPYDTDASKIYVTYIIFDYAGAYEQYSSQFDIGSFIRVDEM